MKRRALVVDDEKMVAALVRDVLTVAGFEVALAHTAGAASEAFETFDPDVAILDISLGPGPSGLDVAHMASESYPGVALLLLTRYPDMRTAQVRPEDLPANCGFLSKDNVTDSSALLNAIEALLHDHDLMGSELGGQANPLARLTPVQLGVLRMVAQGYTSTEIARRRQCSTSAVEKVLKGIYQRLDIATDGVIHPRVEAIRIFAAAAVLPERPNGQ